jgi:hypothetical protein
VPAYTLVWVRGRSGGQAEIEHRNRCGRVPEDALAAHPVKGPPLEALRRRNPASASMRRPSPRRSSTATTTSSSCVAAPTAPAS